MLYEQKKLRKHVSWHFELSLFCMARILEVLLKFLRTLRFARDYIRRLPGRWASLLRFLRQKSSAWWRFFWLGKPGPSSVSTRGTSYSVSEGSAVVKEYVVASSTVPASASHPDLRERTAAVVHPSTLTSLSIGHPYPHHSHPLVGNPPHPFDGRSLDNRSLSVDSIQSRACDRLSIITNSRESIRGPAVGQPSQVPRATHLQFGHGPDPSRLRERPSRPLSPTSPPHLIHQCPRIGIITTNESFSHGEGRDSPVVPPSASSYTLELLSPHDESSQNSLIVSPPTSDYFLPEGRFVQLINSDQLPRYIRNITMQVEYTILLFYPLHLLTDPARGCPMRWQP